MIIMRAAEIKDVELLQNFYDKNKLHGFSSTRIADYFLLLEAGVILGYSRFNRLSQSYASIEVIYVFGGERGMGLGDGLLRATLNYLLQQGLPYAVLLSDEGTNSFYQKEALIPLIQTEAYEAIINSGAYGKALLDNAYFCDINSFFSRKCKGSKGL